MGNRFLVSTRPHGDDASVVALAGEFDLYSAGEFRATLLEAVATGRRLVIVDLAETTFMDSTTLGVLAGAVKRLRQRGGTLAVVTQDRAISKLFELSGLDRVIRLVEDVDTAAGLDGDLPDAA